MVTLADLKPGDCAQIIRITGGQRPYRQKLLSMGLTPHTHLRLLRMAPLGDPIQLEVRGFLLSIRKSEAVLLEVEKI